jgi:hypothetical protein
MDPEEVQTGRSHGGVGFICKQLIGFDYRVIDITSDRLCAIQVVKDQSVLLTIIGAYMPFFNGEKDQINLYVETLDLLQDVLDTHSENIPCIIMGDFNASLPQSEGININWYKSRPFNHHSLLLYDFLVNNDLIVSNFQFSQPVNFTYFKGIHKSYIDHCFVTKQTHKLIDWCHIVNEVPDNVSDHLPVSVSLHISCGDENVLLDSTSDTVQRINWNDGNVRDMYVKAISVLSKEITIPCDVHNISTTTQMQNFVDEYCETICGVMHKAADSLVNSVGEIQHKNKRGKHWWNSDCTVARDRNRFWYSLWRSCDRPRHGAVYDSYKYSKHVYRKACRTSINKSVSFKFNQCDVLFKQKRMGVFWNKIRRVRSPHTDNYNSITLECLEKHFDDKFSYDSNNENDFITDAREQVESKLLECPRLYNNFIFTEHRLQRYIKRLKSGGAPGVDSISAEHVKLASGSNIILHLCNMFTHCFKFGVVPSSFQEGILVPLLKKPSLDPSVPKNYRPVIVSTILSKLMEMYILEECDNYVDNDYQFGFIRGRGTNSAVALAHDVMSYCNHNGSPVFVCSLDAEGAFDGIPHPVLFMKTINIIPDVCWRLLYNWYSSIKVKVKWNRTGKTINVCKGTRQGGLTLPFLFNVFYKDLIDVLSDHDGGITIGDKRFNVFCYADDILLMSTTVSGLQSLINTSVDYITQHGLRFNPRKTTCMINGKNPFCSIPKFYISRDQLCMKDNIEYLGAALGNNCNNVHITSRMSACRRAFHALQSVGLCNKGLNVKTAMHVWSATCKPILTYTCESLCLKTKDLNEIDKLQGKLIKCIVGIGKRYRTTPLLNALNISNISNVIEFSTLQLMNNIMKHQSAARTFYLLMSKMNCKCPNLLHTRVMSLCGKYKIDPLKVWSCNNYLHNIKCKILKTIPNNVDGTTDTIRTLLCNKSDENMGLLRLILKAF